MAGDDDRPYTSVPVPDPTVLTTQAVDRALAAYREVVDAQIKNLETRLLGMDRATEIQAYDLNKLAEDIVAQRAHLRDDFHRELETLRESYVLQIKNVADVSLEKFLAIDTRFLERDTRTAQAADESRISLDAALAAAKEAVSEQNKANTLAIGKSEAATQKQIDAMVQLMATSNGSLEDKITDLKGRLDRGEGQDTGSLETRQQANWSIGMMITVGLALATAAIAIVIAVLNHK